jgi:hypothetical protein
LKQGNAGFKLVPAWFIKKQAACSLHSGTRQWRPKKAVSQFTKTLGLTNHATTHTAQTNFMETVEESKHFIAMMKEKVWSIDPDHILNMDHTPIPFLYHWKRHCIQRAPRPSMSVLPQLTQNAWL